jgi:glyoxylase-like metal-dependent hydrolase (beta-lactamase superfamily II)
MIFFHPLKMVMPTFTPGKTASMPLMAGVLHYDDQLVLVDTGFHEEPDLLTCLQRLNIRPPSIQVVINTHVHPDHVGNNRLFTHARFVLSRKDYEFARDYSHAMMATTDPLAVLQSFYPDARGHRLLRHAAQAKEMARRFWQDDIIGPEDRIAWIEDQPALPPFMDLVPTPGHTPGHHAVVLRTSTPLLLSGDAMPSRLFWRSRLTELVPRFSSEQFQHSKGWIEQFEGLIMGGHDLPFWTATGQYCEAKEIRLH